ncbi:MAG: MBL fold metallo-hydrolase [Acidobacteria bacterium]|nr:MBL fold metallo-hydrolase [Acidobacteriota bacterium]
MRDGSAACLVAAALAASSVGGLATRGAQAVVRTADFNVRGLKASDFPRVKQLADHIYTFEQIDPTKRTVTVNNLIVVTPDGVLVAEGQGTVENTRALVAAIAKLTPQPIKYVVVGSEHGDHTGGNPAFPATATFIASPYSKATFERQAASPGRRASARPVVVPSETVSDRRVLMLGGTEIDILMLGRAHTGGDLEVYLPREKILFMSEVFSNRIFPSMANGYPSEWVETLKKAEAMDAAWYVPAHGFVDSAPILKEEERNFRLALERIIAEGRRLHDAKTPVESASASAVLEPYDAWTRAGNNAFGALQRVYMELDGQLK